MGEGASPFHSGIRLFNNEEHCLGWNDGRNPLPFVLAKDVASAILAAIKADDNVLGRTDNIIGGVRMSAQFDTSDTEHALNWTPTTDRAIFIRQGILAPACALRNSAPRQRPRILHVFSTFDIGGPQVRVSQLISHWGDGIEHWICAHDGKCDARILLSSDAPVRFIHDILLNRREIWSRLYLLGKYLHSAPVDLICTYNWGALDIVLANRLFAKRPMVHHEDGFNFDEIVRQHPIRLLYRMMSYPGASKIVTVSRNLEAIAHSVWKQPKHRTIYLPYGVDVALFSKAPRDNAIPNFVRCPDEIIIGSVARLDKVKNLPLLVRAVALLGEKRKVRLVIIGKGPQMEAFREAALSCGMAGRLVLPGFVSHPQNFLGLFDIFAMSSDSEQFPISLLEAMATALPCIATDVGDCKDILPIASKPFVTPPGDVEALALSLHSLVENQSLRKTLGEANRIEVCKRFSMEKMVSLYEQIYSNVAGCSMPI